MAYIRVVALSAGLLLSDIDVRLSVLQLGCDLRRALAHLEFWVRSSRPRCAACAHLVQAVPEGKCVEVGPNDGLFASLTQFHLHRQALMTSPKSTSPERSTNDVPPQCAPRSFQLALGYKHSSDSLLLSRVLDVVAIPFGTSGESSRLHLRRMSVSLRHFAVSSDLITRQLLSTDDLLQLLERPSNFNADSDSRVCTRETSTATAAAQMTTTTESEAENGTNKGDSEGKTSETQAEAEQRLLGDMCALLDDSERERAHVGELRAAERDLCARLSGGATLSSWLTQSRARRLDYLPYVRAMLAAERRANAVPASVDTASASPPASASPAESPEIISLVDSPLKACPRLTRSSRYAHVILNAVY